MGEKRALLVGTDFFQDESLSRLLAPKEDVIALREALLNPAIGAFNQVELLFNADRRAIEAALHDLFDDRDPDDLTMFYYSGHGLVDRRNQLYFSLHTSDARRPAVGSLEAGYVRARMNDSLSRWQIVILDCCHSGAFMAGAKRAKGEAALTADIFDPEGYGRYVLTACSATEFAFEDGRLREGDPAARPRSVFTRWLVEGLTSGEVSPENDVITIDALYRYARRRVRHEGAEMDPHVWVDQGAGELVIARNPNPPRTPTNELSAALKSSSKYTRLGAVAALARLITQATPDAEAAWALLREHHDEEDSVQVRSAIQDTLKGAGELSASETSSPAARRYEEDAPSRPIGLPQQEAAVSAGTKALPQVEASEAACQEQLRKDQAAQALFSEGQSYELGRKYELARESYEKAAALGSVDAMVNLGDMYYAVEEHWFGDLDPEAEAERWFRKAADLGDARSMAFLGELYCPSPFSWEPAYGELRLTKDEAAVEAERWFRKAADLGNTAGMVGLGVMYEEGQGGLSKDETEAVRWFRKAADLGDARSMYRLGFMYEFGEGGLTTSLSDALTWYHKAANLGYASAKEAAERLDKVTRVTEPSVTPGLGSDLRVGMSPPVSISFLKLARRLLGRRGSSA
jgi:TPR repeat protein